MIDALHRFHGRGSLRFVYQHGKSVRGPFNALRYSCNNRRKTFRVAVVVSRKVHKSAVVRNRIRRRVYEIVRQQTEHIAEPYDLVFLLYSDQVATMPAAELSAMLLKQLQSAGVLSGNPGAVSKQHGIVEAKEHRE